MSKLIITIVCFCFVQISVFALSFQTERIKMLFEAMPVEVKNKIAENASNEYNSKLSASNIVENINIKATKTYNGELNHLGVDLQLEQTVQSKYADATRYLESYLLSIVLNKKDIFYFENKETTVTINNKKTDPYTDEIRKLITLLPACDFNFSYNKDFFSYKWITPNKKTILFEFPAIINLVRGMTKPELENEMEATINHVTTSDEYFSYKDQKIHQTPTGIFIIKGEPFETDDFRSDIYLEQVSDGYQPIFSGDFPVESFSNLFVCNPANDLTVLVDLIRYGGKKTQITTDLNSLCSYLNKDTKVFFGLAQNKNKKMNATIIFYNEVFSYLHMLLVETDQSIYNIKNSNALLKASLYTYIPREDLKKDYFKKNTIIQ